MRITLVYPPNRNIPSSPYGALPLLAGCLGRDGHQVRIVDANLEVFERLVRRDRLARGREQFDRQWTSLRSKSQLTRAEAEQLQAMARLAVVPLERVEQAERAGEILRSAELFRDPEQVTWAYDTLAAFLRAIYSQNPQYYGLKPGFGDELFGYLERPISNPVQEVLREEVVDQILATQPDLVGVCIPFNEQLVEAFALLAALKERAPDLRTIVGGAIVSAYHRRLCTDPRFYRYADFGMPGEADLAFPAFATALERGADLAPLENLYWRDAHGEIHAPVKMSLPNLNDVAAPDFSSVPVGRYFLPHTIANYQTSRGCYYGKCTFCSFDIKQNFRFRKADLVVSDIERIQAQTGLRHMIFWDPLTPPRVMRDVSLWNKDRGENAIYWGAETKFEKTFLDPAFTDLLYAGGGRFLQFGYESGSQRVLDLMVKGNDLGKVQVMLDNFARSGIAVSVQWFIGFPGETEQEARESFRLLDRNREAVVLSSYMGTYTISPDDDVFASGGDLYDVDLVQNEAGAYDFRHRDGSEHYDRTELDTAYMSRGDSENVTRMAFYLYLTDQPERVRELTNFERGGALPDTWEDIEDVQPVLPPWNYVTSYDFDPFTPPAEQGLVERGQLPRRRTHALFATQSQRLYQLSEAELELVRRADGQRTAAEIAASLPGDPGELRASLLAFLRRGVLVVPRPAPVAA